MEWTRGLSQPIPAIHHAGSGVRNSHWEWAIIENSLWRASRGFMCDLTTIWIQKGLGLRLYWTSLKRLFRLHPDYLRDWIFKWGVVRKFRNVSSKYFLGDICCELLQYRAILPQRTRSYTTHEWTPWKCHNLQTDPNMCAGVKLVVFHFSLNIHYIHVKPKTTANTKVFKLILLVGGNLPFIDQPTIQSHSFISRL